MRCAIISPVIFLLCMKGVMKNMQKRFWCYLLVAVLTVTTIFSAISVSADVAEDVEYYEIEETPAAEEAVYAEEPAEEIPEEESVEEVIEEPVVEEFVEEPTEETLVEEFIDTPAEEVTEEILVVETPVVEFVPGPEPEVVPEPEPEPEPEVVPDPEPEPIPETIEEPVVLSRADMGYDITFNTTISCLITNAALTKSQANKLASILHDAYARSIKPVHGTLDGDTVFVLTTGKQPVNFDAFAALATDIMQYAVIDGAMSAEGAYGLPSARDMQRSGE